MSRSFLEENVFLPGTPEEQEEQQKTWEQLVAEDAIAQAPPPPPVQPPPPPSPANDFTSPQYMQEPVAPPVDPMQQALGGLNSTLEDLMFEEQNTNLPPLSSGIEPYNPMADLFSRQADDYIGLALDDYATEYDNSTLSPIVSRLETLEGFIETYRNTGIVGGGYASPFALQTAYEGVIGEYEAATGAFYEGADENYNQARREVLRSLAEIGMGEGYMDRVTGLGVLEDAPITPQGEMYRTQRYIDELNNPRGLLSPTEIATSLALQQNDLRYLQNQRNSNRHMVERVLGDQDSAARILDESRIEQHNRAVELKMRTASDDGEVQQLREEYIGVPDGGRAYVGSDGITRYSPFFDTVYGTDNSTFNTPVVGDAARLVGEFASADLAGFTLSPLAIPLSLTGSLMLGGIEASKALDGYISESGVSSIYNTVLSKPVRSTGRQLLVEVAGLPTNVAQSIWWLGSNGFQGSNRNAADYFNRGDADVRAREQEFQRKVQEQYEAEVPAYQRITGELILALFTDPVNHVTPLTWAKSARSARVARQARTSYSSIIDDAIRTGTEADTAVFNGIARKLQEPQTLSDVARESYVESVLRDININVKGNHDLMREFSARSNLRIVAEPDSSQWEQIVLEEIGRAQDKGATVRSRDIASEVRRAIEDINESYQRVGLDLWDHTYKAQYPQEVAERATTAWRQQLEREAAPDTLWTPLDGLDFRLDDLMRWGHGPQALYDGIWYANVQLSRVLEAGDSPLRGEIALAATPATKATQDFLRTQYQQAGRLDDFTTPQTMGEAWEATQRLYGRQAIPLPAGSTPTQIMNVPGYQSLTERSRASNAQLALIDMRSRLTGINMFDQLSRNSLDHAAFTRARADEIIKAAPAMESQKLVIRDLRDRTQRARNLSQDQRRSARRFDLSDEAIERLTFDDAQRIIWTTTSPEATTTKVIYSLPVGDTLSVKQWTEEQALKAQLALVLDDLVVSRGKDSIWTHTHSVRADPTYLVNAFSHYIAVNHPILKNGSYNWLVRDIGSAASRDMMSPATLSRVEDALDAIPQIVADAPVRDTFEFARLLSHLYEGGVGDLRRPLRRHSTQQGRFSSQFLEADRIKNTSELGRARNDLAMRQMAYAQAKTRLDEHRAILHNLGVDENELARMTPAQAREELLTKGSAFASNNERAFRRMAREFLRERSFQPERFHNEYLRLKGDADRLLAEIRRQESAINETLKELDGPATLVVEVPPYRPLDQLEAFAREFGLQYQGPPARSPVINELSMHFGGPATRAQLRDRFGSRAAVRQQMELRQTLMDSSIETAFALTRQRGGPGPLFDYDPILRKPSVEEQARSEASSRMTFFSESNDRKIRTSLDGTLPTRAARAVVTAPRRALNRLTNGQGTVNFGTALDEVLLKSARGELDDATEKAVREAAYSIVDFDTLSGQVNQAVRAVWDADPNANLTINRGVVEITDATRDRLYTALTDPGKLARGVKDALGNISFRLPSGSQALDDWLQIDKEIAYQFARPQKARPVGDVFSPFATAASQADFSKYGRLIDQALDTYYDRDPIFVPPGKRQARAAELSKMSKVARMGDEAHAFTSLMLERFEAEYGRQVDPYHGLQVIMDGLVSNRPDVTALYSDMLGNSESARRFVNWLRTKADGDLTNWDIMRDNWHRYSPHFGVNRMPEPLFSLFGETVKGKRMLRDLRALDDAISNPTRTLNELKSSLTSAELEEVRVWLDGMGARWSSRVTDAASGREVRAYELFQETPRGATRVGWKKNILADDFDAVMYPEAYGQVFDRDAFTNNIGAMAADLEARRLGYDPTSQDFWMRMMLSVKGNLGYVWLGIPPRYFVNNAFGNIGAELLLGTRAGSRSGIPFLPMPAVVKRYWREQGGFFPRSLSNVFQSEHTEMFLQDLGPARRGAVRRDTLGSRSRGEVRDLKLVEREAEGHLVPRLAKYVGVPKAVTRRLGLPDIDLTQWTDSMAWANESMELNFRRRIYAKELWGYYQIEWGKQLDLIPGIGPELKAKLTGSLAPEDVMAHLTTEVADPRLRTHIMNQHTAALSHSHLQAYEWMRQAMRDYRMRNNFDAIMDRVFPYQFWTTKNLWFAGTALADRPSILLNVYRQYDNLAEQWQDMPPSFKNTLQMFTMPDFVPEVGGAVTFLRPNNITNPALFTIALTAEGMRERWQGLEESSSLKARATALGVGGLDAFYRSSGLRVGPQFAYPAFILGNPEIQKASRMKENAIYGDLIGGAQYIAEPEGYRPAVPFPGAGLETLLYGGVDAGLDKAGVRPNMRVMRGVEWANQLVYGSSLSRQEGNIVGYVIEGMLADGELGDVERDESGNIIAVPRETTVTYLEALTALRDDNLDHPVVRDALNRHYRGETVRAAFNVSGAPFKFYPAEWRETVELSDQYWEYREKYGADAAWVWMMGFYNAETAAYDDPHAMRLMFYWWVNDDQDVLEEALNRFAVRGDNLGNIANEERVAQKAANQQARSETDAFFTKAQPYYDRLGGVRTKFDHDVQEYIESGNMVMVDILDSRARREIANVYQDAEQAGVRLSRNGGLPMYLPTWWRKEQGGGKVPALVDSPSQAAQQELGRRQTEYGLDMVIQQLQLEKYDPETGDIRSAFLTWNDRQQRMVFDQDKYDAYIEEMLPQATALYHDYIVRLSDNEALILADLNVTEDRVREYMRGSVIPELEAWRERRDVAYETVASMSPGTAKDAAIKKYRAEFGQDFYRTSPNERYIIDALAGSVGDIYDRMTISQQKGFRDRYSDLFDERGLLNANNLTAELIVDMATEYGMPFPTSEDEIAGLADAALNLSHVWRRLHGDQRGEWFDRYGDPESAFYVPGLITEEVGRDPETDEEYTYLAFNHKVLGPESIKQVMVDNDITIGEMQHRGGGVSFLSAVEMLSEAEHKKEMDNLLGQFWDGEPYLTEDERLRLLAFEAHVTDERRGHDVLEQRARDMKDRISDELGEQVSWAELPTFIFDPELRKYVETRNIVFGEQGMREIYDKRSDYLIYHEDGIALREYFSEDEFVQGSAHWDADQPALRDLKDRFHDGSLWLQGQPEALGRWQALEAFTGGENSGIEKYVNQLRDDLDKPTWKQMISLVREDVTYEGRNVRAYLQERYATFNDLDVGSLYQQRGQWMLTGPGQGLYQLDHEYFDFYLPSPGDANRGGVRSGSGGSYGSGSSYQRTGSRTTGFARTTIDEYEGAAREVFFLDDAMVGGQAPDAERRMYYAQIIADRLSLLERLVTGIGQFIPREMSNGTILPLFDALFGLLRLKLGDEPTLESWLEVMRWLGLDDQIDEPETVDEAA